MSVQQSYAVIGLGRYGSSVARTLVASGAEVIAVDKNEDIVDDMVPDLPICKCADITDPEVIEQLGIGNCDVAIIAMATNLEASVMAIMLCKEAGVKTVIAKCANEPHRRIMSKVGADEVVLPEVESGVRLGRRLLNRGFEDIMELSENVSVVEMEVRPEWVSKTIQELDLRRRYEINIVAICQGTRVRSMIDPSTKLEEGMKLIVIANPNSRQLQRLR